MKMMITETKKEGIDNELYAFFYYLTWYHIIYRPQ